MEFSPEEVVALLQRAQQAIDEAKRLRDENLRLCSIARQSGYSTIATRVRIENERPAVGVGSPRAQEEIFDASPQI